MESNSFQEKDGESLWCEQCGKRNKQRKLHLYQINFEESIFLCPSNKCNFPLKEKNVQKYIRKRKFTEIGVSSSKRLKNGNNKKPSKKSRLSTVVSLSDIKNCADDYKNRNSFSSSSNDFVEDLMDFSLEALDTPAEIVNIKEKELKVPFVSNEIGSAPTAFSEDMFWNEVFSPKIPHSNIIMDVISSISSDGSIEKKSDIEEMITDFEETLHNTCGQSDSNINEQNYFDVSTSGDLLTQPNILSDKAEAVSVLACTSQINNEPDEEMQQKNHPNHDEIVTLKDVATEIGENGLVIDNQSDSKDSKQNYTDISHNVDLCEKSSSDILESIEGSAISDIPTVSKEPVTEMQLKTHAETNDEIVSQKEMHSQVNEKSSFIIAHQPDSDKNEQSEMSTCLDLSKEPSSVRSIGTVEEIVSEIPETQNLETEQNSKIVLSLNDNNLMYPLWRNEAALCWLDATLCLLVHNHTLKRYIKQHNGNGDCHIKKVVRTYEQAVSLANNELPIANENSSSSWDNLLTLMNNVREDTFLFLQKTMHCTKGENDSPVFSFPLLLREKKAINELFLMDYRWELLCSHCGKKNVQRCQKTLPTFPSVTKDFSMLNASFFRSCFYCEAPEQRLYMRFEKLPNSFAVHFVQGLPTNDISQYDFTYNGTEYKIMAVVQYMMKPPHFVTWVRNVEGNLWLCCDDLQEPITARYNDDPPVIHPSEIHIVMWERQAGNDTPIINEKETATQNDTLIDEFVDFFHNSPTQSPITISSEESDNSNGSADTFSKVKEVSTIASKESTLKPVFDVQNIKALLSVEEKDSLDSQKSCNSGTEGQKTNVALSFKDTQSDVVSCSVEKGDIKDLNECAHPMEQNVLECIGFSEADSDTDTAFSLVEPSESLNAAVKNVNVCTKVSDMAPPIIVEPVTKDNKELLNLTETEIEQTVEIITSNHNVNTQKEANNSAEYDVVFGANGSNLYNYSRKIVSSKGHNIELTKTSTTKELNIEKKVLISNGNMNNETEELTYQMQPLVVSDPSLTTNTDVIELLQRSQLNDETSYSPPCFVTNCMRNEKPLSHNTEICDFGFDSSCSIHKETIDCTIHSPSSVQDEQITNEMQTENNCSDEPSQNSKLEQDCSNLQTPSTMLQSSEITQTNISSASNVNNENEELTFQMQPCDPSLTTNTDITESLQPSKLKDETLHSVPYFTRSCARKEKHKSPNKEMSDSGFDLPRAEHCDKEIIGFPVHSSLSVQDEQILNETPAENNHSGVPQNREIVQNCKKHEKINTLIQNSEEKQTNINNENISNPLIFSNLERLNNFIPNAKTGDNTFVEICESVPLDAPIENGSISYIVEVECPPAVITEQTSQIIVLNSEVVNALQLDGLNQACVQGINQIKNNDSKTSPPNNALHIVLQQDMPVEVTTKNGDALSASASNKTGVSKSKRRSQCKKSMETKAKVTKSIPDLENVPVLSGSATLLLEKLSRVSDTPRKRRAKPFERKLKVQDQKIDLLQESKSALDFSENILSVKLLSSLSRTVKLGDCKTTLNRGRSK